MSNLVFENARATLATLAQSLEYEVRRIEGLDTRAAGIQQHIDALRVQEKELLQIVNDLAVRISAERQEIAAAQSRAAEILGDARKTRDQILADARSSAQAEAKAAVAAEMDAMIARIRGGG